MSRRARLAASAALALSGCIFPALPSRSGRLDLAKADAARPGTTKATLLEALGPPSAIASPGEDVRVPAAFIQDQHGFQLGGGFVLQADAALELFAQRRPFAPTARLYYWYSTRSGGYDWVWILPPIQGRSRHVETSHLWVLVDEDDERVVDVARRDE